jgi:hypothetical protein
VPRADWGLALLLAGLTLASRLPFRARLLPTWDAVQVLYTTVHFGQYGYLLAVLPALHILGARALVRSARAAVSWLSPPVRRAAAAAAVGLLVLAHTVFFASAAPTDVVEPADDPAALAGWQVSWRTRYRFGMWATTAPGLREQEGVIRTYVDAIRREFDPTTTVLVTELGNARSYPWFRHLMYYVPEFPVVLLRVGPFSPGYVALAEAHMLSALSEPCSRPRPGASSGWWTRGTRWSRGRRGFGRTCSPTDGGSTSSTFTGDRSSMPAID